LPVLHESQIVPSEYREKLRALFNSQVRLFVDPRDRGEGLNELSRYSVQLFSKLPSQGKPAGFEKGLSTATISRCLNATKVGAGGIGESGLSDENLNKVAAYLGLHVAKNCSIPYAGRILKDWLWGEVDLEFDESMNLVGGFQHPLDLSMPFPKMEVHQLVDLINRLVEQLGDLASKDPSMYHPCVYLLRGLVAKGVTETQIATDMGITEQRLDEIIGGSLFEPEEKLGASRLLGLTVSQLEDLGCCRSLNHARNRSRNPSMNLG
jgi:hypothetical protein